MLFFNDFPKDFFNIEFVLIMYIRNIKSPASAGLVVYESSRILYEAHLKLSVLKHNAL